MFLKTVVLCWACTVSISIVNCQNGETNSDPSINTINDEIFSENSSTNTESPGTTKIKTSTSTSTSTSTDRSSDKVSGVTSCTCMPYYLCDPTELYSTVDIIFNFRPENERCKNYIEFCCKKRKTVTTPPSPKNVTCGLRNPDGIGNATANPDDQSRFGEFPWMVAVHAIEQNPRKTVYQCGGSLIHPEVVLTAAHCVANSNNKKFKIRAGEWDIRNETEILPHQDREVILITVHPRFNRNSLRNDIALLFLKSPVVIAKNVDVVCLPPQNQAIGDSARCFASGWGRDFTGNNRGILKKTDLPIVTRDACQEALRSTRLGHLFELHKSFVCAGGEAGKDTCKGDGGSPLVCPIAGLEGRYAQAGIVSWGIGECSNASHPGVYVNVALFRDWINVQLIRNHLDIELYRY